jgi:predicted thioesterase
MLGTKRMATRTVRLEDLATARFPRLSKPPVLATARLLEWCEDVAMQAIDGCAVGAGFTMLHTSPAIVRSTLTIDVECIEVAGEQSTWEVQVTDAYGIVARARLVFAKIDLNRYVAERCAPKVGAAALI